VRRPAVAGRFYPGDAAELRKSVEQLLKAAPAVEPEGRIAAALAPHAGYRFSGKTAAATHKALGETDFDTVVIIGHDAPGPAAAIVAPHDYFETPLGRVPVNTEMAEKIVSREGIVFSKNAWRKDHTIEVQLPFLQVVQKKFSIVPILFGTPTEENIRKVADAIKEAAGAGEVIILASTDLSHYPSYEAAVRADRSTLEALRSYDIEAILSHLKAWEKKQIPGFKTAMCARGGVCTAIRFAGEMGAEGLRVLDYTNSGEVRGGDRSAVVGYSSVLLTTEN
jgi:hypothetical protein